MNGLAISFLFANALALTALPRRWAPLPLLIGACYMTGGQYIQIGPFHFTILRLLVLVGFFRALARGERLVGGMNGMDRLLIAWGICLVCSSGFRDDPGEALVFRLGAGYNVLGIYFLLRVFCQSTEDLVHLTKSIAILLVPVALEMLQEKVTAKNLFSFFGGVPEAVMIRDGKLRARGPFGHPILAGTVGAVCIPLLIGIWRQNPTYAKIGMAACLGMVIASTSSGPIMTVIFSVFAIALWRYRTFVPKMRVLAVVAYIVLDIVMKDPAYFLMARVDLTGSSTGWHRAQIIRSAFDHIEEWWLAGTDYTRHWMATGVSFSADHTDITNQYLYYGVWGGIPLVVLFVVVLCVGFRYVGQCLAWRHDAPLPERFMIWSLGACLFSHAITCMSVAYFDQSVMFLYMVLAAISSFRQTAYRDAISHDASPNGPYNEDGTLVDSLLPTNTRIAQT